MDYSSDFGTGLSKNQSYMKLGQLGDVTYLKASIVNLMNYNNRGRLQTGMRGAFGKPQGTVARVHIGQVIMSIRTKLQNKEHVIEALHRAKFKFHGRQKIHISKKWGFTKFNADEFEDMVAEKWLIPDGCGVKYIPNHGPLDKWRALHS
ncbi:hypothetical protein H8958_005220 [Nasalis larvatus]